LTTKGTRAEESQKITFLSSFPQARLQGPIHRPSFSGKGDCGEIMILRVDDASKSVALKTTITLNFGECFLLIMEFFLLM